MKVAVATLSNEEDATISTQAGRAPYYHIYEDGKLIDTWKNPFAAGGGGAGWSVAAKLQEMGIGKVVAGKFGGNMETALTDAGIAFETAKGRCDTLLQQSE
jgi:predicted Fe-Mo cluster-binding NifX family protein